MPAVVVVVIPAAAAAAGCCYHCCRCVDLIIELRLEYVRGRVLENLRIAMHGEIKNRVVVPM